MLHTENPTHQTRSSVVTISLIIGAAFLLFLAILIPNIITSGWLGPSKRSQTLSTMRSIGTALGSYQVDYGIFPLLSHGTFKQIAYQTTKVIGFVKTINRDL
jgi:hypothetical protein